jgi:hypothetical protein
MKKILFYIFIVALFPVSQSFAFSIKDSTEANSNLETYNQKINSFSTLLNGNGSSIDANEARNFKLLLGQMSGQAYTVTALYKNIGSEALYTPDCKNVINQEIIDINSKLNSNLSQTRILLGSDNDMVMAYQNLIGVLFQYNRICQDQKVMDDTKAKMTSIENQFFNTSSNKNTQATAKDSNADPWIIEGGYIRGSDLFCDTGYNKDTVNFKCIKDQTVATCSQNTDYLGRKIADSQGNPSMSCHCTSGYKWVGGTKCQKYNVETGDLVEDTPVTIPTKTNTVTATPDVVKTVTVGQPVISTTHTTKPTPSSPSKGKTIAIDTQKSVISEPSTTPTTTVSVPTMAQPKVTEEKATQSTGIFGKIKSIFHNWFQ